MSRSRTSIRSESRRSASAPLSRKLDLTRVSYDVESTALELEGLHENVKPIPPPKLFTPAINPVPRGMFLTIDGQKPTVYEHLYRDGLQFMERKVNKASKVSFQEMNKMWVGLRDDDRIPGQRSVAAWNSATKVNSPPVPRASSASRCPWRKRYESMLAEEKRKRSASASRPCPRCSSMDTECSRRKKKEEKKAIKKKYISNVVPSCCTVDTVASHLKQRKVDNPSAKPSRPIISQGKQLVAKGHPAQIELKKRIVQAANKVASKMSEEHQDNNLKTAKELENLKEKNEQDNPVLQNAVVEEQNKNKDVEEKETQRQLPMQPKTERKKSLSRTESDLTTSSFTSTDEEL